MRAGQALRLAPCAVLPGPQPQVRRCFVLLPEALGRDQPGCLALVLQHFEGEGAALWSFDALMQVRQRVAWRRMRGHACLD